MKVLLFARYGSLGASSRVRFLQYLPFLNENGIDVNVSPLLSNAYVTAIYTNESRLVETLRGYLYRIWMLFTVWKYNLVIIEKELFPYFPAWAERLLSFMGVRYIVDYDDALFHNYDTHSNTFIRKVLGRKIDVVMSKSALVIAGNDYLANRALKGLAKQVEIIPTVVDAKKYNITHNNPSKSLVVGWIGTPKTSHYLKLLLPTFRALQKTINVRFVAIGASADDFMGTPVEILPWSEDNEVSLIQTFDIGLMPLDDSLWAKGKCGYKLIQYMACGIPVIASPVGVNNQLVHDGENGFLANDLPEWERSLKNLLSFDEAKRREMGVKGRKLVEDWYSLSAQAPRLLSLIQHTAKV